jgi:hypothetical protein
LFVLIDAREQVTQVISGELPPEGPRGRADQSLLDLGQVGEVAGRHDLALRHREKLNAVTAAAGRAVSFASFTVPQYQRANSYFAPLTDLAAGTDTEFNFGVVPYHPADQAPASAAQVATPAPLTLTAGYARRTLWPVLPVYLYCSCI